MVTKQKINDSIFNKMTSEILSGLTGDQKMDILKRHMTKELKCVFEDRELLSSIDAFLVNNLNVSETSRNSFMHRNTLLYRIDKIYRLSKFNVRNFEEAVSFKLLLLIYKDVYKK